MTLIEKDVAWTHVEVDPFDEPIPESYLALNPFGRVPTLVHDGFVLYETTAITRYIDEAFAGVPLQPADPRERARMNQIIAIADSYGYWPMVRQVFSHRVFRPAEAGLANEAMIAEGVGEIRDACSLRWTILLPAGHSLSGRYPVARRPASRRDDRLFRHGGRGPLRASVVMRSSRNGRAVFSTWPSLVKVIPACRHPELCREPPPRYLDGSMSGGLCYHAGSLKGGCHAELLRLHDGCGAQASS